MSLSISKLIKYFRLLYWTAHINVILDYIYRSIVGAAVSWEKSTHTWWARTSVSVRSCSACALIVCALLCLSLHLTCVSNLETLSQNINRERPLSIVIFLYFTLINPTIFLKSFCLKASTKIDLCPRDLPQRLKKCQYVKQIK